MSSPRFRLLVFTLATLMSGSAVARADLWPYDETVYTETVYSSPAAAAMALPTSYVVPSAYVVPTSSVVPTAYATAYYPTTYTWTPTTYVPTAYYPTTYVPTSYYVRERVARRPLFSRRRDYIVPTTIYYPTSVVVPTTSRYYAPTVFEYPLLSEVRYRSVANPCNTCDDSVVVASAPARVERRVVRDEEAAPRDNASRRGSTVESDSLDDRATTPSNVAPAPVDTEPSRIDDLNEIKPTSPTKTRPENAADRGGSGATSPPIPPAASTNKPQTPTGGGLRNTAQPQGDTAKAQGNPTNAGQAAGGAQTGGAENNKADKPPGSDAKPADPGQAEPSLNDLPPVLPIAPGAGDDPGVNGDKDAPKTTRRDAMKPSFNLPRPAGLALLKGRVRSSVDSEPEGRVRVTVSSRTNAFEDREDYTNEAGKFALRLPDGDWTVKVTMPSGRVYPVYEITVTGGLVVDAQGRSIPALVIDR